MFDRIQEILVRPISGFETDKLIRWLNEKKYSEEEIIQAYEYCGNKDINYIQKYLESKKDKVKPSWFNKEIKDKPLKPEQIEQYQKVMKKFYDSEEEWKQRTNELLKESQEYYKKEKIV